MDWIKQKRSPYKAVGNRSDSCAKSSTCAVRMPWHSYPPSRFARGSSGHFLPLPNKKGRHYAPSHKDVYKTVGTGVLDCPQQSNSGRELVFSADLCYNGLSEKPPSGRNGSVCRKRQVTEGACVTLDLYRPHCCALSLSRSATAPSRREPMDTLIHF